MPQAPVFQRPISIGLPPTQPQGARITTPLTLTSTGNALSMSVDTADLVMEDAEGVINNIQTMYVDASNAPWDMVLTFPETQQNVYIQANTQGYYPVGIGPQGQIQAQGIALATSNASTSVNVQFLNVPVQPAVWKTADEIAYPVQATSTTNAGNTAIALKVNNGNAWAFTKLKANVWGVEITGTGATAASDVQPNLAGVVDGTITWDIFVPVLGSGNVQFERWFNPPLSLINQDSAAVLNVPAMGAGQTFASATIYWSLV